MRNIFCLLVISIGHLLFAQNTDREKVIDTVVVTKTAPIIIKNDTLIYDVKSFSEKHDETLENVLSKMKGIKVLPNGEIEVNGKIVRKILINNKEISNLGSALITKSLSHENVENIEIRLKEKNKKIKESVIDNDDDFVTLNVVLKKEVNTSFFGKQRIDIGYNNKFEIAGLTNVFSIKPKRNIQLFAEHNNRGKNAINIYDIKNIGEDSFSKIFTVPVDIDDIKSREHYHEEIYGFDNFTANDKSIVGFSLNLPITEKSDVYVGSFSNYNFIKKENLNEAFLHKTLLYRYKGSNSLLEYNTKNKVQYKFVSNNFKIKTDLNYEYNNQKTLHNVNDDEHIFRKKYINNALYLNNEIEYKLMDKLGLYYNANLSITQTNIGTNLKNNAYHSSIINDYFYQNIINKNWITRNEIGAIYKTENIGIHTLGYRFLSNRMEDAKNSNTQLFSTNKNTLTNTENSIFYKNNFNKGDLSLSLGIDYKWANFPNIILGEKHIQKGYFQYDGNITYNIGYFSTVKLSANSRTGEFPLHKVISGNILRDFNTIFTTRQNQIEPYYNKIYSISYSNDKGNNQGIMAIYTTGISNNLNNQFFENDILYINANQLKSKYHLISISKKGKIKKFRLSYDIVPEAIINTSEQILQAQNEESTTYRLLMGARLGYSTQNKKLKIDYYPKYSYFLFENKFNQQKTHSSYDFLSNNISINTFFINQALKATITYRQVDFIKTKGNFKNLDLELIYKTPKYRLIMNINNILNSKNFIIQDTEKSILNISNNTVFGRYINIGAEIKFK